MPAAAALNNDAKKSSRFELPALNLNFGSITDGTNIPPPPDSPIEKPKPTKPEVSTKTQEIKPDAPAIDTSAPKPAAVTGANGNTIAGTKRPADDVPSSPTPSGRPGSLRRLFSRNMLNNTYADGQEVNGHTNGSVNGAPSIMSSRPASRSGGSFMDDRKARRSSGWFQRLRSGGSKRASLSFEQQHSTTNATANKASGPPPPMIPELKDLEKDEGSLGNDLFKNIK